jgi:hypothetical protein
VTVYAEDGAAVKAMVYVMTAEHDAPAIPSRQYYGGIAEGFRSNGILTDTLEAALDETYSKIEKQEVFTNGLHTSGRA